MNTHDKLTTGVCLGLALILAACGGETEVAEDTAEPAQQPSSAAAAPEAGGYTVMEVTNGGTIRGTVHFAGTVPPPRTVTVTEDMDTCGSTQQIQTVEVGADRGLANAVVSLVDITRGAAFPPATTPPTLDQRGCQFAPHVLLAAAGETVRVLNNDPLTHNVHTASFDNRPVNRAQPQSLRQIEMSFREPEKIKVKCDMHAWMTSWIIVVDHPYHAITDQQGGFVIENVPPGTYTLEVWHETVGSSSQTLTVTEGQTTKLSLELSQD